MNTVFLIQRTDQTDFLKKVNLGIKEELSEAQCYCKQHFGVDKWFQNKDGSFVSELIEVTNLGYTLITISTVCFLED